MHLRQKHEINYFIQAKEAYADGRYEEGDKLAKKATMISVICIPLGLVLNVIAGVILAFLVIDFQSELSRSRP